MVQAVQTLYNKRTELARSVAAEFPLLHFSQESGEVYIKGQRLPTASVGTYTD
jgi:hypothetical protein